MARPRHQPVEARRVRLAPPAGPAARSPWRPAAGSRHPAHAGAFAQVLVRETLRGDQPGQHHPNVHPVRPPPRAHRLAPAGERELATPRTGRSLWARRRPPPSDVHDRARRRARRRGSRASVRRTGAVDADRHRPAHVLVAALLPNADAARGAGVVHQQPQLAGLVLDGRADAGACPRRSGRRAPPPRRQLACQRLERSARRAPSSSRQPRRRAARRWPCRPTTPPSRPPASRSSSPSTRLHAPRGSCASAGRPGRRPAPLARRRVLLVGVRGHSGRRSGTPFRQQQAPGRRWSRPPRHSAPSPAHDLVHRGTQRALDLGAEQQVGR